MGEEAKEIQLQEIEALESIYMTELCVICADYPNICLELTIPLPSTTLPAKYPNECPLIILRGIEDEQMSHQLHRDLQKVALDNLGMSMVFTLVTELQDIIGKRVDEKHSQAQQEEYRIKELADKAEQIHFEGTRVTVEQFKKWKNSFMEEITAKKDAEIRAKEALMANRLTGKQLFLKDDSLNFSDLQFTSENAGVEIDESLFEDDINLSDDSDDGN